jgi:hypothetical protein
VRPGGEVTLERARQLAADEVRSGEYGLWWLSFADPDGQRGEVVGGVRGFLGVAIVRAHGLITATQEAKRQGCNPGGQVQAQGPYPIGTWPSEWCNRLLSADVVERMPAAP